MDTLIGYQFHQLVEVPRPGVAGRDDIADDPTGALLAALTGAHSNLLATGSERAGMMSAWIRPAREGPLRFVVGGRPFFPPAGEATVATPRRRVLFPPGATAVDLPQQDVWALLGDLPFWTICTCHADALSVAPDHGRSGSFDRYAAQLREPFAWLVLAEPLTPGQLRPELDLLVNEIVPLARGEVSEAKRVALERKQARHRELSRVQAAGFWQLRVLVGAANPASATTTAAMLCAASELDSLPYALSPGDGTMPLTVALASRTAYFVASTELLVALTRPPIRELPGIRLVRRHTFDVTPESTAGPALVLGQVVDDMGAEVGPLALDRANLNRHTFVCGATGAGKSHTVRHLLEQCTRDGLPWLVIEPAKAEYATLADRIGRLGGDVIVIRPGDPDRPAAGLNPLQPAPGFPLQTHADLLRALFLASFDAQEPFPQILAAALTRCYEELGWDLTLGEPAQSGHRARYPNLSDLQRVAETVVTEIGYGREISDNVRGFIKVRLASLRLGTTGRFFEGGHPIDFDRLHTRNVILEIEDVGDDADKAFLMGVILIRLAEHLRVAHRQAPHGSGLRHLTVVEEAHRLLRRPPPGATGPAAHAVELFAALLAEVRAYGEGLVIVEQIPSKLIPDVIKNTAVKIVHRLPAQDDRESVGASMNLDAEQSDYLVTLPTGVAAVFADRMDRPLLVRLAADSYTEGPRTATGALTEVIGRRSSTCATACQARPCTLRDMRAAHRLLADQPWLLLWAELAVLAHLGGHPAPVPRDDLLKHLASAAEVLDCAVSHAVDDAVAVRSGVLQPTVGPFELADHVVDLIRRQLHGARPDCGTDALGYLARPYRWELVRWALFGAVGETRHPASADWETRFRQPIPGQTRTEQLTAVTDLLVADITDQATRDAVAFGTRRPSTMESVVGATAADSRWPSLLASALIQFEPADWPAVHLLPSDVEPAR